RLGLRSVLALGDRRDRVLDQDRLVGNHVVDLLTLLLRGDRLVLVGDQHVAVARGEVVQRVAAALVLDLHVLGDQLVEVGEPRLRVLAGVALGAVGRQQVPLRGPGGEGVRREDLDTWLEQVIPRVDVLRVALAHDQRHDGPRHQPVRRRGGPVRRHQPVLDQPRDVGLQRERHDVRGQPRLDRPALVARRPVGLRERHALALRRLAERGDQLVVDDLRGRVGDKRALAGLSAAARRSGRVMRVRGSAAAHDRERDEGRQDDHQRACLHESSKLDQTRSGLRTISNLQRPGEQGREADAVVSPPRATIARPVDYPVESFSPAERARLAPHVTNLDRPVFALVDLPETVKGALFARYSRYGGTLRRLFLDEFAESLGDGSAPAFDGAEGARAAELYERIFVGYGDDSVAQLGGAHVACEWASNVLTKILQRPRLGAYLEQSTRYIAYDAPMPRPPGGFRYHRDPELGAPYEQAMDRIFVIYANALPRVVAWAEEAFPPPAGEPSAAHRRAIKAKALDLLRGLLPAASLSH